MTTLNILATNDLHSALERWPNVTALLKHKRDEAVNKGEEVWLFDIGDHCDRVHAMTEALKGQGNVELLNDMAYDAVTIGNNEGITFSKEDLMALYADAQFPVILNNLFHEDGSRPEWAVPSLVMTTDEGAKIGLTGATVPFRQFYEPLGWHIADPAASVKAETEKLKQECDFIICLSHLGYHEDETLAENNPDLDLIFGSHTHHLIESGVKVRDTWISQSGRSGNYIGEVQLSIQQTTEESFRVTVKEIRSVPVDKAISDPQTEAYLDLLQNRANRILAEPLTVLKSKLEVNWYEPSFFTALMADTVKEWCDAEISMVNAGVLLDSLGPGTVTRGDVHTLCPHPINPVTVAISGDQLLETVRQARSSEMTAYKLKGFGFRGKVLGHMAFAGLQINQSTSYISDQHVRINGVPIERKKTYTLATLDMFTLGRLYPPLGSAAKKNYFMPEFLRDLLAWKLIQLNGSLSRKNS
ncbi:bifunctional metallophosphatase/5'-nucleotidase [Salisediminibacterium halotolerans]|uniref:2',3'-cyclic-nucleotide 2'-phosphodiesterase/5'-or 3'-nucleotidase, 5'-nucleotidase family n=1 Tax=Salisediminibacterium halotolerans TaxID=517425 RepID=A0A1H9VND7_9BACI|nr:bifunctional UDP-sugar hydrolase/5'-nucleotidase [Salisediminibacterium haloalkalitolerans]SES22847.1 2',3'-cyclic-nucleotide 2'-phosphodiesterase/5'-or 3'-nucleotidase, 5'-nucleotidase family [Salisediminibacterium haloalkalitolerans]